MKLTNSYQAITIESDITKDQLKAIKKYAPEACTLIDENKVPVFAIEAVAAGNGEVGTYGISFDAATQAGNLYVTTNVDDMPENAEARRMYLEEEFGTTLFHLKKIEDQLDAALATHSDVIASVTESIHIM